MEIGNETYHNNCGQCHAYVHTVHWKTWAQIILMMSSVNALLQNSDFADFFSCEPLF